MDDIRKNFEKLYQTMKPGLLAYFRAQPALAGAAEDLFQETFLRAFRSWEGVRGVPSTRAYVFGIARHVGLDALRQRRPVDDLKDAPTPEAPNEDPRLEPLRAAIARLPPPQREALELRLRHDLTYEEIAAILQVPVGTVRSRLHYAVTQLQELLNPHPSPAGPRSTL